jgi:DUF1365 family protein
MTSHTLYTGTVMHARRTPAEHVFRYRVAYFGLDVDRLDELNRLHLAGYGRRRLVTIRDADYLAGDRPLADAIRAYVRSRGHEPPSGPIRLVTSLRLGGYVFNPVSFWYLADAGGQTQMVVAEVNNTFGERRPYLLEPGNAVAGTRLRSHVHPKELHVSPFFGMDQTYRFFLSEPGERLYARIDVEQDGGRPFIATLAAHGEPLSDVALLRTLARNPLLSGRVTGLIHWQAVRLWLKGVPVFRKPSFTPGRGSAR